MTDTDNKKECPICGQIIDLINDEYVFHDDGEYYHEDCFNENFIKCDECGKIVPREETTYLNEYDKYVCDNCLDTYYYRCDHCDSYVHQDNVYWGRDERPYCEDCFNEYFTICENCDETIWRDDAYYDSDGYAYCPDCWHNRQGIIYDYHDSSVEYIPKYLDDIDRNENYNELYGLELEIGDDYCETAEGLQSLMNDDVVLMHDGSVDGYEMISMPISRQYFYKEFIPRLDKGLQYLRRNDARGHNKGGIHIHFKQFNRGLQTANAVQILYGDVADLKIWLAISQRREGSLERWASMTNNNNTPKEILEFGYRTAMSESNYHGTALNYDSRTETHELRIFNSNLRLERVIKNMECLFALEDYIKLLDDLTGTTRGYLKYILDHAEKYPYLLGFLVEKNILDMAEKFYTDFTVPTSIKRAETLFNTIDASEI